AGGSASASCGFPAARPQAQPARPLRKATARNASLASSAETKRQKKWATGCLGCHPMRRTNLRPAGLVTWPSAASAWASAPLIANELARKAPSPSDHDLREMLHEAVVMDLLGPAVGPEEEILGTSVRDRYLVGKLAPKESLIDQGDIDDLAQGGDDGEDGSAERATLVSQSIVPSSLGITFCVDASCEALEVEATWGHYRRIESEIHMTDAGNPKRVWKRRPAGGKVPLALQLGEVSPLVPDAEQPAVFVRGVVRRPTAAGEKIVTLFLVNDQEAPETNQDEAWLFQAQLALRAPS